MSDRPDHPDADPDETREDQEAELERFDAGFQHLQSLLPPRVTPDDLTDEEKAPLPPGPPVPVRFEEDGTPVVVGTVKPGPVDPYRDDSIPVAKRYIPPPLQPRRNIDELGQPIPPEEEVDPNAGETSEEPPDAG